jgi:hypothetical protein
MQQRASVCRITYGCPSVSAGASAQALYPTLGAAVLSQPNDYKIFAAAVAAANLTAALELSDVTVFIPSDEVS